MGVVGSIWVWWEKWASPTFLCIRPLRHNVLITPPGFAVNLAEWSLARRFQPNIEVGDWLLCRLLVLAYGQDGNNESRCPASQFDGTQKGDPCENEVSQDHDFIPGVECILEQHEVDACGEHQDSQDKVDAEPGSIGRLLLKGRIEEETEKSQEGKMEAVSPEITQIPNRIGPDMEYGHTRSKIFYR